MGYGYRYYETDLALPDVKSDLQLTCIKDHDPELRKPVSVSLGCHVDGVSALKVDRDDPETMVAGVAKRFGVKTPEIDPELLEEFRSFVRKWVRTYLVPLVHGADLSFETWLRGTNYPEWRKEALRATRKKLDEMSNAELVKIFRCKSFGKDEFYTEEKHERGINSRDDMFKCLVGPIFKAIETVVYAHPAFIKHVPVAHRPTYIRDLLGDDSKPRTSDYTAFEALFVPDLMHACEFELYKYMTANLAEATWFSEVCDLVLAGRNRCDFKYFSVFLSGVRMSGEMCTSLGNGFTNLMAMLFMCERAQCTNVRGVVEGDDGLFAMDGQAPSAEDFAKLGLVIKLVQHTNLCSASFCGLIFDPEDMVNIADPLKILATFGWASATYRRSKPEILRALLRCKALSLLAQYPGAPVIQSLALYGLRATGDVRYCKMYRAVNMRGGFDEWHRKEILAALRSGPQPRPVPTRTRDLMAEVFGLSVRDQLCIESYLDSLNDVVPLEVDQSLFPRQWRWYAERYVTEDHGDRPILPVARSGTSIYSLFYCHKGMLLPYGGSDGCPRYEPPPARLAYRPHDD